MTIMSILLLIIFFLAFFIYFSDLNPQDISIVYFSDHTLTTSLTVLLVACILIGLSIGYMAHIFSSMRHLVKHWKRDRVDKKARDITATYREGVGRLLSGDVKKAGSLLQKALERDPSRVDIHIALASVHLHEGNPQDGINVLLKARDIEPKNLEVLFKLATTYLAADQDESAEQAFEDILNIESGNRKALRSLRDLHVRLGHWPQAMELQKRVLKAGPSGARLEEEKHKLLCLRYEIARQALGEEPGKAEIKELQDIAKHASDFTPARVSLGDAYRTQGRPDEAARVWQEGYLALGKSVFLSRLEDLYLDAEDPASLLGFYRTAVAERGDDLMFRLFYGKLCLRLEMVDEALDQLHVVEGAGVDTPQLHLLLGEASRRRDRIEEAIEEYKKALGADRQLRFGYVCESCTEPVSEWESRCQTCGTWGSFALAGRQAITKARPAEMREIYHGERSA
ncbi:tetratricopeptide repeat protein [uncultured Desulfuromonas sp.]|uniref:tetratricopeptide repeat protein n=1 Tax=uncultured Desulfuromonas sp. TaxID=181013 RepID=UPI00262FBC00|nr:tetratricopeptide repeat protein [uncultured Desulfuromonas sp.]